MPSPSSSIRVRRKAALILRQVVRSAPPDLKKYVLESMEAARASSESDLASLEAMLRTGTLEEKKRAVDLLIQIITKK